MTSTRASRAPVLSIFALIAGVVGLLLSFVAFIPFFGWVIQLVLPVVALILGFRGRRNEAEARGFWLTGIVLGFVGLGIAVLSLVFTLVIVVLHLSAGSGVTG